MKMKYFLVNWDVSYQGSDSYGVSVIKKAANENEAIANSLNDIGGEHSVVDFTQDNLSESEVIHKDGTMYSIHSNTGVCYTVGPQPGPDRCIELEVIDAVHPVTREVRQVLVAIDEKTRPSFYWRDGKPRYNAEMKWTSYTDSGDIAAVHLLDSICGGEDITAAEIGIMKLYSKTHHYQYDKGMIPPKSVNAHLDSISGDHVHKDGLNQYEIERINPLEVFNIELEGVVYECFVPTMPNADGTPYKVEKLIRHDRKQVQA